MESTPSGVYECVNGEVEKTMPNAAWFPPPACGAGCEIDVRQGVLQRCWPLSIRLKRAVLPGAAGSFSLVPRVKSWSDRRGRCYTKMGLWGRMG